MGSDAVLLMVFYIDKLKSIIKRSVSISTEEMSADQLECLMSGIIFEGFDSYLPGWWKHDEYYQNLVEIQWLYSHEDYTGREVIK